MSENNGGPPPGTDGALVLEVGEDGNLYVVVIRPPVSVKILLTPEHAHALGTGMVEQAKKLRPGLGLTIAQSLPPL